MSPRPAFRPIAFLAGLFIFGLSLFAHGCMGWLEGAMVIRSKNQPTFVATPDGDTAFSFYVHTMGFMGFGGLMVLLAMGLTWFLFFSSSPRKHLFISIYSQSAQAQNSAAIPNWLFWFVVVAFIAVLVYAAAKVA